MRGSPGLPDFWSAPCFIPGAASAESYGRDSFCSAGMARVFVVSAEQCSPLRYQIEFEIVDGLWSPYPGFPRLIYEVQSRRRIQASVAKF